MIFEPMVSIVPGMALWGAKRGNSTFIISIDYMNSDEIRASVKVIGTKPFDNTRHDLGVFDSIQKAMDACRKWKPD